MWIYVDFTTTFLGHNEPHPHKHPASIIPLL